MAQYKFGKLNQMGLYLCKDKYSLTAYNSNDFSYIDKIFLEYNLIKGLNYNIEQRNHTKPFKRPFRRSRRKRGSLV